MNRKWNILAVILALLLLSGCSLRTLDALYQVPKRSDDYNDLQSAIDKSLGSLEYCAPLSGENLTAVQTADLDGDSVQEYLLFAKGTEDKPLQILIFRMEAGEYVLSDTIESHGTAFDLVEYARMDDCPGYEIIVGCQISQDVARSVSVYSLRNGKAAPLMSANYTKFLTCDLAGGDRSELMVLRPGESDEENGLAELYRFADGGLARSDQINLSASTQRLKRIELGQLQDGKPAVYVDMAVGANAVVTDVFTVVNDQFVNLISSDIPTLREDYVYAEDIDGDGVVELPRLIEMRPPVGYPLPAMQQLICWYALTEQAQQVDKLFSYHNLQGGWYMTLDGSLAPYVAVTRQGSTYEFYIWNDSFIAAKKIMTVFVLSGSDRKEQAQRDDRFAIYQDDTTVYAVELQECAAEYGFSKEKVIDCFHLIHQDWKTQEVLK